MFLRNSLALASAFVLTLLAFSLAPTVRAETDALSVGGAIHTIDPGAKTITIKKADNSTVTLKYDATTVILRNGKQVKPKALMLHDVVTAKHRKSLLLTKLNATGPKSKKVAGQLMNALKGNGTVTIGDKTVKVTAATRIARNGKIVSLSALTRKDRVVAHVKSTALSATASGALEAQDLLCDGPENDHVHGLISAISGNQVTITPSNGTTNVTVNVTDTTMIEVNGEDATLNDLTVGMQVEAHFNPTTFDAYSIETDSDGEADDAHVHGTVSAVDVAAGTLTIVPTTGDPITLRVDASTEIEVNDTHGTLEDIQVGMPVQAEYDTTTMLAMEIKAGAGDDNQEDEEIEGTVVAVDTTAQTVTITPNGGGNNLTLNVTTETEIEVNGEPAKLTDIQVGARIQAEYDPLTLNAFELKVGAEDGDGGGNH